MGIMGKPCDSCRSAVAVLFCRADAAFLGVGCDARIHCANRLASRHERVWLCEVCEQAPAAVTCKADAASLCISCDANIHSANPLARRHDRVPVQPFFDHPSAADAVPAFDLSWAHALPSKSDEPVIVNKASANHLLFSEMDSFLDFDYPASADSVVPVKVKQTHSPEIENNNNNTENLFHAEFSRSKLSSFAYAPPQCLSHSVSSSSLDVGVVPDRNSVSEISFAFGRTGADPIPTTVPASSSSTTATISPPATQLCGLDREARVLRYREKRKNRKFEKTIRYASRKAYAETRPRIKGRFAKRTDAVTENYNDGEFVDNIYGGSAFLSEAQYGVVPSFCPAQNLFH